MAKRCDAGDECVGVSTYDGATKTLPYFVADDETLCDRCLLITYMGEREAWGTHDSLDHEGVGSELFEMEDVVAALRKAEKV